jgi:predicted amidophosphoribosyltransferase
MFEQIKTNLQGEDIIVLGTYRPWGHHKQMGGDGSNWPEHSRRILDLKEGKKVGVDYFFDYMSDKLKRVEAIAIVPSHDPAKGPGGLHTLARRLAASRGCVDASSALRRHTKIDKLASGGDRSIGVHLNSIDVPERGLIKGNKVLLVDDVMTSGNSLLACRKILLKAGASEVKCVALGRTTY